MRRPLSFYLRGLFHIAVLAAIGAVLWKAFTPSLPAVTLDDQTYRVSGPYDHENLSVYLIHADQQDERPYITLQEGLEKGLVKVSEKEGIQVLQVDNQSDLHLFLQEGDRLQGGKQDRTIYASHVVPPRSGPQELPAFCIERSRWSGGEEFKHVANTALAPQQVRLAAKYQNDQHAVWANVAKERQAISANIRNLDYKTTSLNEALESAPMKELCDGFALALQDVVKQYPDAVGVAIVINGQVEEVNIYPNHGLLGKQYPRLMQSYAMQALSQKDEKVVASSALDVARTMQTEAERQGHAAPVHAVAAPRVIAGRSLSTLNGAVGSLQERGAQQSEQTDDNVQQQRLVVGQSGGQAGNQTPTMAPLPARETRTINGDNRMELFQNGRMVGGKTAYQGKTVHRQIIRR